MGNLRVPEEDHGLDRGKEAVPGEGVGQVLGSDEAGTGAICAKHPRDDQSGGLLRPAQGDRAAC